MLILLVVPVHCIFFSILRIAQKLNGEKHNFCSFSGGPIA